MFSKSTGTGLSITAVCKNSRKKTLGQDDFFVVDAKAIVHLLPNSSCSFAQKKKKLTLVILIILYLPLWTIVSY